MAKLKPTLALRMTLDACSEAIAEGAPNKKDDYEGPEECCICLTTVTLSAMGTLGCGHNQFHYKCIADWGALSASCPICKAKFSCVFKNGREFRLKKVKPVKEMQLSVEDDYEESDYEEEDDFDNCPICSIKCIDGDGKSVFCDCGESVHLFCIGRRIENDSKRVDFTAVSRDKNGDDARLWTCVECTRVGRISSGATSSSFSFSSESGISNHDSSSLSGRRPRTGIHDSNTLNHSRNQTGILNFCCAVMQTCW